MTSKKMTLSDKVGYITIGSLITQFGRLITMIVVARFVLKETYGTYNQMFLVYGIFSPIFLSGIPGSILYFFPIIKDEKKRIDFISQTISLLAGFGAFYALIIFLSAPIVAHYFNNPDLVLALRIFSLYPVLNFIYSYFQPYLVASHDVKKTPILFSITAISNLFFMAGAVVYFPTVSGLAWASVLSMVPPVIYAAFCSRKFIGKGMFQFSRSSISEQLKYSFPLGLASVIGQISYQVDRMIVSVKFSPATYAIYAVGAFEVPVVALIGQAVNSVLVPEIAQAYKDSDMQKIFDIWKTSLRKMALIVFPAFVATFVLADILVPFLFSAKYVESIPLFRIYLLLMPIRIASYGLILRAIGRTRVDLIASLFYLVINTVVNIILVNVIGLWGPAIGTVICTTALAGFYVANIKKYMKINIMNLLPLRVLGGVMLISVLPGALIYFLSHSLHLLGNQRDLIQLTVWGALYLAIYGLLILNTKFVTRRDKELILKWTKLTRVVKIK